MARHTAQHIRPEVAQELLAKNAAPLVKRGGARRRPPRLQTRSRSGSPEPQAPPAGTAGEEIPETAEGLVAAEEARVPRSAEDAHWRTGPPPEAAEGSGSPAAGTEPSAQRRSRVTVEDVEEDEYEGEVRESAAEARAAALEEEQDRWEHEQESGWAGEDEFDEQFWAELEAEVHQAAGYARKCFLLLLHALNGALNA
jgi:hypothetical protein